MQRTAGNEDMYMMSACLSKLCVICIHKSPHRAVYIN